MPGLNGVFGDCIWQLCYRNEMLKLWKGSAVPSEPAGMLVGELCAGPGRIRLPAGSKAQVATANQKLAPADGGSAKPGL